MIYIPILDTLQTLLRRDSIVDEVRSNVHILCMHVVKQFVYMPFNRYKMAICQNLHILKITVMEELIRLILCIQCTHELFRYSFILMTWNCVTHSALSERFTKLVSIHTTKQN